MKLRMIVDFLAKPIQVSWHRPWQVAIKFHIWLFALLFILFSIAGAIAFAERLFGVVK